MFIFDAGYWVIIIVSLVLSGITSIMVKVAFSKGKKVQLMSGISGAEAAKRIIDLTGLTGVTIKRTRGFLSDYYNPLTKTLALSPDVYDGRNASAVGVAAHEAGHAIQHARGYFPLWIRSAMVPVAGFGSSLGIWLILIGMGLQYMLGSVPADGMLLNTTSVGGWVAWIGIIGFGIAVVFSVVTVPVEFNASRRAKEMLAETGVIQTEEETSAVSSVLRAAGLTYVAAAVTAVLQLAYWLFRLGVGSRD